MGKSYKQMGQHPGRCAALAGLLLLGAGCGADCPTLRVKLSGTDGAQRLLARANGPGGASARVFDGDLGSVALGLKPQLAGADTRLTLLGLGADGCVTGAATVAPAEPGVCLPKVQELTLSGGRQRRVTVRPGAIPPDATTLRVQVVATGTAGLWGLSSGGGPVEVWPVPIPAGATLEALAPDGPAGAHRVLVEAVSAADCVVGRGAQDLPAGCAAAVDVPLTALGDARLCQSACSPDGWCRESPAARNHDLFDVTGADDGTLWAVGAQGLLLQAPPAPAGSTSRTWTQVAVPTGEDLHGVYAVAGAVWAVGKRGAVLRRDPTSQAWQAQTDPALADRDWHAVWGAGDTVIVVGSQNAKAVYQGGAWRAYRAGTVDDSKTPTLLGVYGRDPQQALVVGGTYYYGDGDKLGRRWGASVQRWDGADFRDALTPDLTTAMGQPAPLHRVWADAAGTYWVAGGCAPANNYESVCKSARRVLLRQPAGQTWAAVPAIRDLAGKDDPSLVLSWVGGLDKAVFALGVRIGLYVHQEDQDVLLASGLLSTCAADGTGCAMAQGTDPVGLLRAGYVQPQSGDLWAVGDAGAVVRLARGKTQAEVQVPPAREQIQSLYAASAHDLWAVGFVAQADKTVSGVVLHGDGVRWTRLLPTPDLRQRPLHGVASDGTNVWMISDGGYVARVSSYSDAERTVKLELNRPLGIDADLQGIRGRPGEVWVVGKANATAPPATRRGVVLRYRPPQGGDVWSGWTSQQSPETGKYISLLTVEPNGEGDLWIGGGQLDHPTNSYDGQVLKRSAEQPFLARRLEQDPNLWVTSIWSGGAATLGGGAGRAHVGFSGSEQGYGYLAVYNSVLDTVGAPYKLEQTEDVTGLFGVDMRDVWAVSSRYVLSTRLAGYTRSSVLHYDGTRWSAQRTGVSFPLATLAGVDGGQLWAAGEGGTILRRRLMP